MANLDDLGLQSLTDKTVDQQLEHLRQIRLSRRTPKKKNKKSSMSTRVTKPKVKMSAEEAAELLKLLGES